MQEIFKIIIINYFWSKIFDKLPTMSYEPLFLFFVSLFSFVWLYVFYFFSFPRDSFIFNGRYNHPRYDFVSY